MRSRSRASSAPAQHRAGMTTPATTSGPLRLLCPGWRLCLLGGLGRVSLGSVSVKPPLQIFGYHLLCKTTGKCCSEPCWPCQPSERVRGHKGGKGKTGETSAHVYVLPFQKKDDAFSFGNRVRPMKYLQNCINKPRSAPTA